VSTAVYADCPFKCVSFSLISHFIIVTACRIFIKYKSIQQRRVELRERENGNKNNSMRDEK
jgi:hypothetical protein